MKSFEKETIRKQLKDESQCLKDLEKAYEKARKDCQEQLRRLNSRKDMQNLQSIIYQKKYQTALLKQIDGVLNDLQTHTYKTANEFFQGSYQNGYIGSMYELQKEGIPFTIPVDPKKMVKAIQTDSKISKEYYLGKGLSVQNIRTLKKQIALEATRGIASGQGWLEVAESLAVQKCFQISLSDSMRICRTEGNRINQQARLDAGDEAVQNGCDILKQWDATLDGKTRPAHQEADGQIREWGEDFIVMGEKLPAPSVGGSASNVCNCRCQLLKRPRWALDDEELQVLKDRASYYGLDKTKNFEEYKDKFLKLPPVPVQVQVVKVASDISSTTTKFKDAMSEEDYKAFCKLVEQNPEIAKLYKHADEIPTIEFNSAKAEYWYQQKHLYFNYPKETYIGQGMSKYQVVSHEYGHFVDRFKFFGYLDDDAELTWEEIDAISGSIKKSYINGWKIGEKFLSNSDQFLSALRSDMKRMQDEGTIVSYCLDRPNTTTSIQDAVDGYGLGRILWGHGDRYYNREYNNLAWYDKNRFFADPNEKPTKQLQKVYTDLDLDAKSQAKTKQICRQYDTASELWANIMSAETTGGAELETVKEKFPDCYKAFKEILKVVNK